MIYIENLENFDERYEEKSEKYQYEGTTQHERRTFPFFDSMDMDIADINF